MATIMSQYGAGGGKRGRHCNGTCHNARRPKCCCICGGRYHGHGDAAQAELTRDWLGEDWRERGAELVKMGEAASEAEAAYQLYAKRVGIGIQLSIPDQGGRER